MPKITLIGEGEVEFGGESSILDALDEAELDIPYSCRDGNCGACEVILLSGEVEYLQDPSYETSESCILICCAIPITNVSIELM